MLFGEHAVVYGRPCIVTAVDQRIRVSVQKLAERQLQIEAPDVGISEYKKDINKIGRGKNIPKGAMFIEYAVRNFKKKFGLPTGIKIETKSDFSSKFGFGSSSAAIVAALKAISELFQSKLTQRELFDLSYKTVLQVQGVGSGFDLAAAIWGGTIYFVGGGKKIIPIKLDSLPLVVGYTGIKADTSTLVKQVGSLFKTEKKIVEMIFETIENIVNSAKTAFPAKDYRKLGELMNLNQGLLDSLGVNTKELSDLIIAVRSKGAYGAKLSGAGGGDCMIALVDGKHKKDIEVAIIKAGGKVLDVKTGADGVRIEK
jgi:mevalonate kinase